MSSHPDHEGMGVIVWAVIAVSLALVGGVILMALQR